MPKMNTVAHFELDLPGATHAEMREAEALMRDPDYIAAVTATVNAIAGLQAKKAGVTHTINITGSIASVAHSA
jgi:hypothetical protein